MLGRIAAADRATAGPRYLCPGNYHILPAASRRLRTARHPRAGRTKDPRALRRRRSAPGSCPITPAAASSRSLRRGAASWFRTSGVVAGPAARMVMIVAFRYVTYTES